MNHIIETKTICLEEKGLTIRYHLFESVFPDGSLRLGIAIINETTGEESSVSDLTLNPEMAKSFFSSVVRGTVTPVHLKDLAEDVVADFSM